MKILVTGGAGYIGSHTLVELLNEDYDVIVVDNLSNSSKKSIQRLEQITNKKVPFYEIDLRNRKALQKVFKENKIDAVIHFAGLKSVGESLQKPLDYYDNNLVSTLVLIDEMRKHHVQKFVFSSSANVYGSKTAPPVKEGNKVGDNISNPYGRTKFMIENILKDIQSADNDMEVCILRYFNPIGAHDSGLIGEDPRDVPSNILPFISLVALGKHDKVNVYGNDYNTPDGTGIRDYIHVVDLAKGHLAALRSLKPGLSTYNLGTGKGTSVFELIDGFSKASGKHIPHSISPRRDGDIPISYAAVDKVNKELGWFAEKTIEDACRDAWLWHSKNPNGYGD